MTRTSSSRRETAVYILLTKAVRWLLFAAILLYLASGLGISEYRSVEHLTFGLLTKPTAFRLHDALLAPFVALLVLHVSLPLLRRALRRF